jgi:hypothetical protein
MEFTRITAHFDSRESALKAQARLNKKCPEHFNDTRAIGKKVSFENDNTGLTGLSKKQLRLIMEEAADNVQHHLNDCKGFSYSTFVKR